MVAVVGGLLFKNPAKEEALAVCISVRSPCFAEWAELKVGHCGSGLRGLNEEVKNTRNCRERGVQLGTR